MAHSGIRRAAMAAVALCLVAPATAFAGGYDTPMLYNARHMGMGGTAIASVDDAASLFHNPAGLSRVERLSLTANFSPLIAGIQGSPSNGDPGTNIDSDTTFAPFFFVGGAVRITDWLAAGLAVYPVASAGATYNYTIDPAAEASGEDSTTLFFLEISPGLSFQIPQIGLSVGAGYRMTYVSLSRTRDVGGNISTSPNAGFDMDGWSFAGFRAGIQFSHPRFRYLSVGAHYRHKTRTDIDGSGFILDPGSESDDWTGSFTLPSRFSFGVRGDVGPFGLAIDAEYALQDQNPDGALRSETAFAPVTQRSQWTNAWTFRAGAEYRLLDGKLPIRAGYVWDQRTTNPEWVSAFGTPPAATQVFTIGTGWNQGPWQANIAYAYRTGSATIAPEQIGERSALSPEGCSSCGFAGNYEIGVHGVYLDFSYHFGRGETHESGGNGRLGHGVVYGSVDSTVGAEPEAEDDLVFEPEPAPEPEAAPEPAPSATTGTLNVPAGTDVGDIGAAPSTVEAPGADPADVRIEGDHLEIDGHILFESGSDVIRAESNELLDHIATMLRNHASDIAHMRVIGHTDAAGGPAVNMRISEQRAAAVVRALQSRSVPTELESSGMGETQHLCEEDTEECHARNRRVEFLIVMDGAAE